MAGGVEPRGLQGPLSLAEDVPGRSGAAVGPRDEGGPQRPSGPVSEEGISCFLSLTLFAPGC